LAFFRRINPSERSSSHSRFIQEEKSFSTTSDIADFHSSDLISRNNGVKSKADDVKALTIDHAVPYVAGDKDLKLAGKASQASMDFLTLQIKSLEAVLDPIYRNIDV